MTTTCRASVLPRVCAAMLSLGAIPAGLAQLVPDRVYFGIHRPIPMTVSLPADLPAGDAPVSIRLLAPVSAEVVASASVVPGKVDLAGLFPLLWTAAEPLLLYAQLVVGEQKIGPAVVLQPMTGPLYCLGIPENTVEPVFALLEGKYTGLRAWVDQHVVLDTSMGRIELALRPDAAPNTAWNFLELVRGGFYTDIPFHRIVHKTQKGFPFVVQVGDPTGTGEGGPGYFIDLEPSTLPHDFGVVSMARTSDPNTAGSQFFICLSREGTAHLDRRYTSFAFAVSGGDVILALGSVPVGENDRPVEMPILRSATAVPAPPYGEGPPQVKRAPVQPTGS